MKKNLNNKLFFTTRKFFFISLIIFCTSKTFEGKPLFAGSNPKAISSELLLKFSQIDSLILNNDELKTLEKLIEEAKYKLKATIAERYPTLDLVASGLTKYVSGKKYTPSFNTESSQWSNSPSLVLNWELIDPERAPSISSARNLLSIAQNNYEIKRRDLVLLGRQKFLDFQRSKNEVVNAKESLSTSKKNLSDTEARLESGLGNKLEVLEAKSQYLRDLQFLNRKIKERKVSKNGLLNILNINKNLFTENKNTLLGFWNQNLEKSFDAAVNYQLGLKNIIENKAFNFNQSKIASASNRPNLVLSNTLTYTYNKGELNRIAVDKDYYDSSYENTISLNFNWRLFDGGQSKNLKLASIKVAESEEINYENAIKDLRKNLDDLFNELTLSQSSLTFTLNEANSTKEQLKISKLRYNSGLTSQREVINSQREATSAITKYNQTIYEYNVILDRLRRITGLDFEKNCNQDLNPHIPEEDEISERFCETNFKF